MNFFLPFTTRFSRLTRASDGKNPGQADSVPSVKDAMRATTAFRDGATKKELSTARGGSSVWRIDNQPVIHLSMKAFLLDGETLDCLDKSSHLSRFFSVAEFGP